MKRQIFKSRRQKQAMLLKVIVYAYTQRVFSSRRIAKELWENVNYMWLSACRYCQIRRRVILVQGTASIQIPVNKHVCIDHGCLDVYMPRQFLNSANIIAAFQQVSG